MIEERLYKDESKPPEDISYQSNYHTKTNQNYVQLPILLLKMSSNQFLWGPFYKPMDIKFFHQFNHPFVLLKLSWTWSTTPYRADKIYFHNKFDFNNNLHRHFVKSAIQNRFVFLTPNPPCSLFLQTSPQFNPWDFTTPPSSSPQEMSLDPYYCLSYFYRQFKIR
jgi:hypothetical protein